MKQFIAMTLAALLLAACSGFPGGNSVTDPTQSSDVLYGHSQQIKK